jgi:hypothetical protein
LAKNDTIKMSVDEIIYGRKNLLKLALPLRKLPPKN